MHSCIYEGRVHHVRREPITHRFQYRLAMAYLDLNELGEVADGLISGKRFAPASFLSVDHQRSFGDGSKLGDSESLADLVRDSVEKSTGNRPVGPIRLLTQLRYFGHYFSPLNLFYCFTGDGAGVESIVAEVSNTPWNQRHLYVLHPDKQTATDGVLRYRHPKSFHVSPFMGMEATYDWRLSTPGGIAGGSYQ